MAIPEDLNSRFKEAFLETDDVADLPGLVVINPDGSSIGGGGGPSDVTIVNPDPIPVTDTTPQGTFYMSTALAAQGVIRATPGALLSCNGRFDLQADAGQYFLQFYDAAAVPADGAVTILHCVTIEHVAGFSDEIKFDYPRGKAAAAGISFSLSSTEFTKTEDVAQPYLSLEIEHRA